MHRFVSAVAAVAAVVAVVASPASARPMPTYTVTGVETGIPQEGTSPFAGVAFSSTAGFATWTAHVTHASLADCATLGNKCITGGDFAISGTTTITGTFKAGSISLISGSPVSCTPMTVYAVTGKVDLGRGTATFTAKLTHYQLELGGNCLPYFATVSGTFGR